MSIAAPAGFLLLSLMSWVIIIGLQRLTNRWLIPHDPGTYIHMGGIATLGLLDFPTDYMAFGAFYLALAVLLVLPRVKANVRIVDGRLVNAPGN